MRRLLISTVVISLALFLITHQTFAESCECDLNSDGTCDGLDWLLFYPEWGRTDCPPIPAAPVPQTGQTNCYDEDGSEISCAGTGQDGEYQMGVTWPDPRFTDNGDGTVRDNLTGLIWLKNANCYGLKDWSEALGASNNLVDGQCGLSDDSLPGDWRLPNVGELQSLIDYNNWHPPLPSGHPFIAALFRAAHWSSTTKANDTTNAWSVDFYYSGNVNWEGKTWFNMVWPVRGGN
jgi:hypothetical protein